MKRRSFLLKALSLGLALTLACGMFPMPSLRAEEPGKKEEQEEGKQGEQEEEQESRDAEDTEEIIPQVIEIHNADEFLKFADQCFVDSWSADKKVLLTADIDLKDTDFCAVPVFAGAFDGQGHTISGFSYSGDGYVAGFFRYIEKDGLVENLTLKGEVIASDEKECIGGLCGVNYGTIYKCSFQGTVSGRNTVGGLAGINEGTGAVRNCSVGGRVTGYYSTGGIVGKNHGEVVNCTNRSCINNDTEWVEEDDEMGTGIFLSISLKGQETELFSGVDTGGIAGHSDGMIMRCINYGRIGYEHTGYNIGGIAGRQSGVVSSCINHGAVYGRKDVGGIVGQMEPYIEINEATSLLHAVNRLHDLMAKTLDDMQEGKDVLKEDLDSLVSYSRGAVDAGDALAGQMADFVDNNMDQAQAMTDRIGHVMDMLPDVFDDVYAAEDSFSSINKELSAIADSLKEMGEISGEYIETDYNRLTLLSTVGGNILSIQQHPVAGETVRILVEPDRNYGLDSIKAADAGGSGIVMHEEDGNYTFTMPEANVRVEAYFSYQGEDAVNIEDNGGNEEIGNYVPDADGGWSAGNETDAAASTEEENGGGEEADGSKEGNKTETADSGEETEESAEGTLENGTADGVEAAEEGEAVTSESGTADGVEAAGEGEAVTSESGTADGVEAAEEGEAVTSGGGTADGVEAAEEGEAVTSESGTADGVEAAGEGEAVTSGGGTADGVEAAEEGEAVISGSGTADGEAENGTGISGGGAGTSGAGAENGADRTGGEGVGGTEKIGTLESQAGAGSVQTGGAERQTEASGNEGAGKPVVKLSSNLSGNASCEIDGSTAILKIIPDGAYTVDGVSVKAADGQGISVSGSGQGEYAYTFDIHDGSVYQADISFRKLDKSQAVNSAKDDISNALKRQQEAADKVNAIIKEIQDGPGASKEQLEQLAAALGEMSGAASAVLSNLSVVSNVAGQQAADKISDMGSSMEHVLKNLQDAVDAAKSATKDAGSIVDYVNGQPDIRFSKMGMEFDGNRENLHEQLKGMSNSLESLSGNASDYSDVLNDDLRAVNDQINVIFNILTDNLTSYSALSMEELYEDVDVEDTESITTGKTDNCTNEGIVKGDINIGGIAGAMSIDEEDPEDSAAGSVDYQIGRRYFTKCIITGCVNEGYVTAKKDGAGGIVGYMKHGIVVDSEGYGSVESIEGDYVGGICGESLTVIKRCYALCSVSGGKNVGGIAGFADTLKDCYAIVDCNASIGRKGAIAGQTVNYDDALDGEEVKVSGNCYVGDNLYGIDNISYVGVAEPVSYSELLTVEDLPTQFRHLKVIFRVDDLYLGVQEVRFGEKLSCLKYPEIPEREGYYGVWPDYSDKVMTGNLLVKGEYKEDVTVLQSSGIQTGGEEGEPEKPYALVEQRFTEDTVLDAAISVKEPPEQAGNRENVIYDIVLKNAEIEDTDTFAIRLYNPYKDAAVWGYQNGTWQELESKVRGQYLQVAMTGAEQTFCVAEHKSRFWIFVAGTAGGMAALFLAAALVKKVKHGLMS